MVNQSKVFGFRHVWDATFSGAQRRPEPDGRYHLCGNYFHTYTAAELDFLDAEALAASLDDLLDEPVFLGTT